MKRYLCVLLINVLLLCLLNPNCVLAQEQSQVQVYILSRTEFWQFLDSHGKYEFDMENGVRTYAKGTEDGTIVQIYRDGSISQPEASGFFRIFFTCPVYTSFIDYFDSSSSVKAVFEKLGISCTVNKYALIYCTIYSAFKVPLTLYADTDAGEYFVALVPNKEDYDMQLFTYDEYVSKYYPTVGEVIVDGQVVCNATFIGESAILPIRRIFESLGYRVDWINDERKIAVAKGDSHFEFQLKRSGTIGEFEVLDCEEMQRYLNIFEIIDSRTYTYEFTMQKLINVLEPDRQVVFDKERHTFEII